MRFADFHAGQTFSLGPRTLEPDEIMSFARSYDPQQFHCDPDTAARTRWGGLVASGWQTCGLAMRLVYDEILSGSESIGSPGLAYVKWPTPVRPGEPLMLHVDVLEVRRSVSRPEIGILRWRWRFVHRDDRVALDLEATTMFEVRE